MLNRIKRQY